MSKNEKRLPFDNLLKSFSFEGYGFIIFLVNERLFALSVNLTK